MLLWSGASLKPHAVAWRPGIPAWWRQLYFTNCVSALRPSALTTPGRRSLYTAQTQTSCRSTGSERSHRRFHLPHRFVLCRIFPGTGADFHRAVVATAPGEKLLVGRRPPCEELDPSYDIKLVFLCRKLHLFLGKSTKTAATRAALFDSNMHQIVCRLQLRPQPHLGNLQRFCRLLSCI